MKQLILFICSGVLLISCSTRDADEQKALLLEADRSFSLYSEQHGRNSAFLHYCSDEAVMLREDSRPLAGRAAIDSLLSSASDTAYILTWEPLFAELAASGDLGYTYGIWTLRFREYGGEAEQGTYVTVWKKEGENWKWVLDAGSDGLKPQRKN